MFWHEHLLIVSVWIGCHLLPQPRGALCAAAREPHGDVAPVPGLLANRPGRGEYVGERQASGSIQPQALFISWLRPPVVLGGGSKAWGTPQAVASRVQVVITTMISFPSSSSLSPPELITVRLQDGKVTPTVGRQ